MSTLKSGGTERVAAAIAEWLRDSGHSVSIMTLSAASTDFFRPPEGVTRHGLALYGDSRGFINALNSNIRRIRAIRHHIRDFHADVVISLGDRTNILGLFAVKGLGCKTIISERTDPERANLNWRWRFLRRVSYRHADVHVAQSNYAAECIQNRFTGLHSVVIPNSIPSLTRTANPKRMEVDSKRQFRLLSVGRLSSEKGFDVLLAAFKLVHEKIPSARLTIVGRGPAEVELKALARELGLSDCVDFAGEVTDISHYYETSDVFILSSRREGFPNVILEAMSFGVPVVATACPGGVQDLIVNGRSGLLVPVDNAERLGDAILSVLWNRDLATELREAAASRLADYESSMIGKRWIETVSEVFRR